MFMDSEWFGSVLMARMNQLQGLWPFPKAFYNNPCVLIVPLRVIMENGDKVYTVRIGLASELILRCQVFAK